jgi:hypothetical protein
MPPKTMKVRITEDAEKLWSCTSFVNITDPRCKGKKPWNAGVEIEVYLPGETPSPFCQADKAWKVVPESAEKFGFNAFGKYVCEHQVDMVGPQAISDIKTQKEP